jgi:hypothetical protein
MRSRGCPTSRGEGVAAGVADRIFPMSFIGLVIQP